MVKVFLSPIVAPFVCHLYGFSNGIFVYVSLTYATMHEINCIASQIIKGKHLLKTSKGLHDLHCVYP